MSTIKTNQSNLFYIVLVALTILVIAACSASKKTPIQAPQGLSFKSNNDYSLSEVIELAKSENKLVFVDFVAEWCLPCQIMEEEVFNKKPVISYMNKNFINYKVDIEKANGANLKLLYGAAQLPTLLFLDTNGRELERREKAIFETELLSIAKHLRQ